MKEWFENSGHIPVLFTAFLQLMGKLTSSKGGAITPATVSEFQRFFRFRLGKKSGLSPSQFEFGILSRSLFVNGKNRPFTREFWKWFKEHRYALAMALGPVLTEETATKIVSDTIAEFDGLLQFPASGQLTMARFQNGP